MKNFETDLFDKLFDGHKPLLYSKKMSKLVGSHSASILFSFLISTGSAIFEDGGVRIKIEDILQETGLSERVLRTAREKLKERRILSEELVSDGVYNQIYFRINLKESLDFLSEVDSQNINDEWVC